MGVKNGWLKARRRNIQLIAWAKKILGGSIIAALIVGPLIYFGVAAQQTAEVREGEGMLHEAAGVKEAVTSETPIEFPKKVAVKKPKEALKLEIDKARMPEELTEPQTLSDAVGVDFTTEDVNKFAQKFGEDETKIKLKNIEKQIDGGTEKTVILNDVTIDYGLITISTEEDANVIARFTLQKYLETLPDGNLIAVLRDTTKLEQVTQPDALVISKIRSNAGKWYIDFDQYHEKLPVYDGRVKMILTDEKKLLVLTDSIKRNLPAAKDFTAGTALAKQSTQKLFEWDESIDKIDYTNKGYYKQNLIYKVEASTHNPLGKWDVYVNGIDGNVEDIETDVRTQDTPPPPAEAPAEPAPSEPAPSEPAAPIEEPIVTEPTPAEEPVVTIEPTVPTEEPVVPAEEPTIPAEEPVVPTQEPVAPVEEPVVPSEQPTVPAEEPTIPTETITEEPATIEPEIEILEAFFSQVLGKIFPKTPNDTQEIQPFSSEHVYINQVISTTDAQGYFQNDARNWYSVFLDGPYVTIEDDAATVNAEITDQTPEDPFTWDENSASLAAINAFYHTNKIRDWFATTMEYEMNVPIPTTVNSQLVQDYMGGCGAWFDNSQKTIEIGRGGEANTGGFTSCPDDLNYALSSDIVYHEYTHYIVEDVTHLPNISGAESAAMGEGLADYFADTINDDSIFGDVVSPNNTRNLNNTLKYKYTDTDGNPLSDMTGESHYDGQIFAGALWDLRTAIGAEATDKLVFNTLYQGRLHFETFMYGMIIEDDDDGDFSNGTPHLIAIIQAFENHGIGPGVANFNGLPMTPEEWDALLKEAGYEGEEEPFLGAFSDYWACTGSYTLSGTYPAETLTVNSGGDCTLWNNGGVYTLSTLNINAGGIVKIGYDGLGTGNLTVSSGVTITGGTLIVGGSSNYGRLTTGASATVYVRHSGTTRGELRVAYSASASNYVNIPYRFYPGSGTFAGVANFYDNAQSTIGELYVIGNNTTVGLSELNIGSATYPYGNVYVSGASFLYEYGTGTYKNGEMEIYGTYSTNTLRVGTTSSYNGGDMYIRSGGSATATVRSTSSTYSMEMYTDSNVYNYGTLTVNGALDYEAAYSNQYITVGQDLAQKGTLTAASLNLISSGGNFLVYNQNNSSNRSNITISGETKLYSTSVISNSGNFSTGTLKVGTTGTEGGGLTNGYYGDFDVTSTSSTAAEIYRGDITISSIANDFDIAGTLSISGVSGDTGKFNNNYEDATGKVTIANLAVNGYGECKINGNGSLSTDIASLIVTGDTTVASNGSLSAGLSTTQIGKITINGSLTVNSSGTFYISSPSANATSSATFGDAYTDVATFNGGTLTANGPITANGKVYLTNNPTVSLANTNASLYDYIFGSLEMDTNSDLTPAASVQISLTGGHTGCAVPDGTATCALEITGTDSNLSELTLVSGTSVIIQSSAYDLLIGSYGKITNGGTITNNKNTIIYNGNLTSTTTISTTLKTYINGSSSVISLPSTYSTGSLEMQNGATFTIGEGKSMTIGGGHVDGSYCTSGNACAMEIGTDGGTGSTFTINGTVTISDSTSNGDVQLGSTSTISVLQSGASVPSLDVDETSGSFDVAGTLNAWAASTVDLEMPLTQSAGAISIINGTVSNLFTGTTFTQTGGTMTIGNGRAPAFTGAVSIGGTLTCTNGSFNTTSSMTITSTGSAALNNTFTLNVDSGLTVNGALSNSNNASSIIDVTGNLVVSGASGNLTANGPITTSSTKLEVLNAGTATFNYGQTTAFTSIEVQAPTSGSSTSTATFASGSTFSTSSTHGCPEGSCSVEIGTESSTGTAKLTYNNALTIGSGKLYEVGTRGTLELAETTHTNSGTFVNRGTVQPVSGLGTIQVSMTSNSAVNNYGTFNLETSTGILEFPVNGAASSTFTNYSGGIVYGRTINLLEQSTPTATFTNQSGGSVTAEYFYIYEGSILNNSGLIDGVRNFNLGNSSPEKNGGTINNSGTGQIDVDYSGMGIAKIFKGTLNNTSTANPAIRVNGPLTLGGASGDIGTLQSSAGVISLLGTTTAPSYSLINLDGGSIELNDALISGDGTISETADGKIVADAGTTLTASGEFDVSGGIVTIDGNGYFTGTTTDHIYVGSTGILKTGNSSNITLAGTPGLELYGGEPRAELAGNVMGTSIYVTHPLDTRPALYDGYVCIGDYYPATSCSHNSSNPTVTLSGDPGIYMYSDGTGGQAAVTMQVYNNLELLNGDLIIKSGTAAGDKEAAFYNYSPGLVTIDGDLNIDNGKTIVTSDYKMIVRGLVDVDNEAVVTLNGTDYEFGAIKINNGTEDTMYQAPTSIIAGGTIEITDSTPCGRTNECAIILGTNSTNTSDAYFEINGDLTISSAVPADIVVGAESGVAGGGGWMRVTDGITLTNGNEISGGGVLDINTTGVLDINGAFTSYGECYIGGDGTGAGGSHGYGLTVSGGAMTCTDYFELESGGSGRVKNTGTIGSITVDGSTTVIDDFLELDGLLDTGMAEGDTLTVTDTGHISSGVNNETEFFIKAHDITIEEDGRIASDAVGTKSNVEQAGSYGGDGYGRGSAGSGSTYGQVKPETDYATGIDDPLVGEAVFHDTGEEFEVTSYGGGGVRIYATGDIINNGEISADGGTSTGYGTGSGGTVIIVQDPLTTAQVFEGTGEITADGGSTAGYDPGGGGRIIIDSVLIDDPDYSSYGFGNDGGTLHAYGGTDSTNSHYGAAGTIVYLGDENNPNGTLIVDQGAGKTLTSEDKTYIPYNAAYDHEFDRYEVRNSAKLDFSDASGATQPTSCYNSDGTITMYGSQVCNSWADKPDTLYINDTWAGAGSGDEPSVGSPIVTTLYDLTPAFSAIYRNPDGGSAGSIEIQVDDNADFSSTKWDYSGTITENNTDGLGDNDGTLEVGERSADVEYAGTTLSVDTPYYIRARFSDSAGTQDGLWTHRDIGDHYNFEIEGTFTISNDCSDSITILDGANNIIKESGNRYGSGNCGITYSTVSGADYQILFGMAPGETNFDDGTNVLTAIDNEGLDCKMTPAGTENIEEYAFNISGADGTPNPPEVQYDSECRGGGTEQCGTSGAYYDENTSCWFDIETYALANQILIPGFSMSGDHTGEFTLNIYVNASDSTVASTYDLDTSVVITTDP